MGTVSELNAHRMAVSLSAEETVLWDQITWTGDPGDFAWILPVMGTPTVELADNGFFEALEQQTLLSLQGPILACTPAGSAGGAGSVAHAWVSGVVSVDMASVDSSGRYEGCVGPYEMAFVPAGGTSGIVDWLRMRGYAVPTDAEPVIQHYVDLGMGFVVLRLRPNAGVNLMRPVRVRTPGLGLTLPLEMVSVGSGMTLELELYVLAEGRMGVAAPFGNAEVERRAITFDYATGTYDYDARFEDALFAGTGRYPNWVTEVAVPLDLVTARAYESTGPAGDVHRATDDLAVVTAHMAAPYLTRLRTRVQKDQLDTELTLTAADGGDLGTAMTVVSATSLDFCPDAGPADAAAAPDAGRSAPGTGLVGARRHCGCGVARTGGGGAAVALLLATIALAARRRRA
jgi:hypothetical protein